MGLDTSSHLTIINNKLTRLIFISLIFLSVQFSFGQANLSIKNKGFNEVSDSIIKHEIAGFTITGSAFKKADSLNKKTLTEIPIRYCSEKEVSLWWQTFTSSVSTFIHFYFKGESSNKLLDSIYLVTHSHFLVTIPKSAVEGLYQSKFCDFKYQGKKGKYSSPYYKAFYSTDKRRLYIYMLGETNSSKYEITWVIINDKYFDKVLDNIP